MLTVVAFLIALAMAVFVAAPLLATGKDSNTLPIDVTPLADLKRRRLVVYENLRDLEFEYRAGKVALKDYESLRDAYRREAASLMVASREIERGSVEDAFIEGEVAARRARRRQPPQAVPDYTCPRCGFENPVPVKFCGECGAEIRTRQGPRP